MADEKKPKRIDLSKLRPVIKRRPAGDEASARWLQKKNREKGLRIFIQVAAIALLVYLVLVLVVFPRKYEPYVAGENETESGEVTAPDDGGGFIAISYAGITALEEQDSTIVSRRAFQEQMDALNASGYVTITQQDILDYYQQNKPLPEKALFLIFEDGILNTTSLVQSTLEKYNYIATMCTYADNLDDVNTKFATASDLRRLVKNSYWEMGSNGYRLSYINVFDRYGNYFGHLNTNEFVTIDDYLRRDYNHYLMDFLRDEDRLRQETVAQMNSRIEYDYGQMQSLYQTHLGYVPPMYILMHSNTGAFGNDSLVSDRNRDLLTALFAMNFNRQGSCVNTRGSSIYDLTRLQAQSYFSTNHLLMRIHDDTGDSVAFAVGDEAEAKRWYSDRGVAEYKNNEIILTTEPYGEGRITLNSALISDLDMSVTLQGNKVGVQSVYLRTDRDLSSGVQVALENNQLVVRELDQKDEELFRLDLFEFDGGAVKSEQEDEYEGLVALYNAIIRYDEDPERVSEAQSKLDELLKTYPIPLPQGDPFVPALDIADTDSRTLRLRLNGKRLSLWLDGRPVAENLLLGSSGRGNVALGAAVWKEADNYSQKNIFDDVYDAVFVDPIIHAADDGNTLIYSYQLSNIEKAQSKLETVWDRVTAFFLNSF